MPLNAGFTYRETIDPRSSGRSVLAHLVAEYRHTDEAGWRARLGRGEVTIDGRPASAGEELCAGQSLDWARPPWDEPDVPRHFSRIFEDDVLLAVDKPSGLPTMPGGGFLEGTLLSLVRREAPQASPMHRLGRGTSGLVLFSLTPRAAALVQAAWRGGKVRKLYRALVQGRVPPTPFVVDAPIGPISHPTLGTLHAADPAGRPSRSLVRAIEARDGETLVEVEIPTGRPHQIRIHLAFAGHPLVGDPLYAIGGRPLPGCTALPGDLGYWLHAGSLELRHPITAAPLSLRAPPPPPLRLRDEPDAG